MANKNADRSRAYQRSTPAPKVDEELARFMFEAGALLALMGGAFPDEEAFQFTVGLYKQRQAGTLENDKP